MPLHGRVDCVCDRTRRLSPLPRSQAIQLKAEHAGCRLHATVDRRLLQVNNLFSRTLAANFFGGLDDRLRSSSGIGAGISGSQHRVGADAPALVDCLSILIVGLPKMMSRSPSAVTPLATPTRPPLRRPTVAIARMERSARRRGGVETVMTLELCVPKP
jgi:hypothetical protein